MIRGGDMSGCYEVRVSGCACNEVCYETCVVREDDVVCVAASCYLLVHERHRVRGGRHDARHGVSRR